MCSERKANKKYQLQLIRLEVGDQIANLADEAVEEQKKVLVNGEDQERYWMVESSMSEDEQSSLV